MTFDAKVTGIINSNNKTGIFVEIEDKSVVGMVPATSDELLDYVPGQSVKVAIEKFEVAEDKEPFVIKNNNIIKCYFFLFTKLGYNRRQLRMSLGMFLPHGHIGKNGRITNQIF